MHLQQIRSKLVTTVYADESVSDTKSTYVRYECHAAAPAC